MSDLDWAVELGLEFDKEKINRFSLKKSAIILLSCIEHHGLLALASYYVGAGAGGCLLALRESCIANFSLLLWGQGQGMASLPYENHA